VFIRLIELCVRVPVRQDPVDDESSSEDEEGFVKKVTPLAFATSRQYSGSSSGVGDSTVAGGKVAKPLVPPEGIFGAKKAYLFPAASPAAAPSTGMPSIPGTTKPPATLFAAPASNITFGSSSTTPVFGGWNPKSSIFPFLIDALWYRE